ncbi:MAG: hypothetical protein ACKOOH_09230, partial [Cyanobium sp.]
MAGPQPALFEDAGLLQFHNSCFRAHHHETIAGDAVASRSETIAIQAFYEYNACLQEPWDGPALLVFSDGRMVGATLDRNGLRPARYCITRDGFVVMGSETGVVELEESRILEKGRLGPGQMLAVDLMKHRLLRNWDVKAEAAERHPYAA